MHPYCFLPTLLKPKQVIKDEIILHFSWFDAHLIVGSKTKTVCQDKVAIYVRFLNTKLMEVESKN